MSEGLIRDYVETQAVERQRAEWSRVAALQTAVAVLQTRFEAALERAVQGDDLKELKREMEAQLQNTISYVREHFDTANKQQSTDILGQVQGMLANQQIEMAAEQRRMRQQIFFMVFASGLSVIGALFVFWATAGRP